MFFELSEIVSQDKVYIPMCFKKEYKQFVVNFVTTNTVKKINILLIKLQKSNNYAI